MSIAAPVLTKEGQALKWTAVAGYTSYVVHRKAAGQKAKAWPVTGLAFTPPVDAGVTAEYLVRVKALGALWSNMVSIAYAAAKPVNASPPAVSGTGVVGQTLSCSTGVWTGAASYTYAYQWLRDGSVIAGATASSYVLVSADGGHSLSCTVTAKDSAGETAATSNVLAVITELKAPVNTALPAISGVPEVAQALKCSTGTWTGTEPIGYAYQWLHDGVAIANAIESTYTVTAPDAEQQLSCRVTASNAAGGVAATSTAVRVLPVKPPPPGVQLLGANVWPLDQVSTAEGDHEAALCSLAGMKLTRISTLWSLLEPTKGVASSEWFARLDALVASARTRGMKAMLSVVVPPAWANGGLGWQHSPTNPADYGVFCGKLAERYGQSIIIEGWNEPNSAALPLIPPAGKTAPQAYGELIRAAVSSVAGRTLVLAGSLSYADTAWLAAANVTPVNGICEISLHPYADGAAPGDTTVTHSFKGGIEKMHAAYPGTNLWITEFGYKVGEDGMSEATRAQRIRESFQILQGLSYVAGGCLYECRSKSDSFGLVDAAFTANPAYAATSAVLAIPTYRGYTAANPMPAGVVPYAATAWPNTRVPATPTVLSNSAAMVTFTIGTGPAALEIAGGWYHPEFYATEQDPLVELIGIKYGTPGAALNGTKIRCPVLAIPAPEADHHMSIILPDGTEYGLWKVQRLEGGKLEAHGAGIGNWATGNGTAGATASGFCNQAGVIRAPELIAGVIGHALFGVVSTCKPGHIAPAIEDDGTNTTNPNAPQQGQRFYLPYTDAEIAALSIPAWRKAIVTACAHYGWRAGDSGGGTGFGFQFEGPQAYTAYGLPNPFATFAAANGGLANFDIATGVDWSRMLAIA